MKQLPESFCIAREGRTPKTCQRWKRFIEYLRHIHPRKSEGFNGGKVDYYGFIDKESDCSLRPFGQLLTLDQFEEIIGWKETEEQWQPKPGEMVQVSNYGEHWYDMEFIAFAEKAQQGKYVVYSKNFNTPVPYNYCRPIPKVTTYSRSEAIKLLSEHTGKPESEIEIKTN